MPTTTSVHGGCLFFIASRAGLGERGLEVRSATDLHMFRATQSNLPIRHGCVVEVELRRMRETTLQRPCAPRNVVVARSKGNRGWRIVLVPVFVLSHGQRSAVSDDCLLRSGSRDSRRAHRARRPFGIVGPRAGFVEVVAFLDPKHRRRRLRAVARARQPVTVGWFAGTVPRTGPERSRADNVVERFCTHAVRKPIVIIRAESTQRKRQTAMLTSSRCW